MTINAVKRALQGSCTVTIPRVRVGHPCSGKGTRQTPEVTNPCSGKFERRVRTPQHGWTGGRTDGATDFTRSGRTGSKYAAGLGRGLKEKGSDHAVNSRERRGRIDSRDAAGVGLCSGVSDTGRTKGARTMQPVRPRGGTGNDSVVAVEF